jgi:hypothetical protein
VEIYNIANGKNNAYKVKQCKNKRIMKNKQTEKPKRHIKSILQELTMSKCTEIVKKKKLTCGVNFLSFPCSPDLSGLTGGDRKCRKDK